VAGDAFPERKYWDIIEAVAEVLLSEKSITEERGRSGERKPARQWRMKGSGIASVVKAHDRTPGRKRARSLSTRPMAIARPPLRTR